MVLEMSHFHIRFSNPNNLNLVLCAHHTHERHTLNSAGQAPDRTAGR